MSRLYKSPNIRNTSKIPLTTASKNIVRAQYDMCNQMGAYYVFMSRENNPKTFINFSKGFDWCDWKIHENMYLVGSQASRQERSSWQYIMSSKLEENENIDDYLESMTEEECNELCL